MSRILFVDDDQNVLDGLRDSLRSQRRRWEMVFALGGHVALEHIEKTGPFDVVISDMRMPDMDGAEFLRRVKKVTPGSTRIVLSGQAEEELLLRALPVAHQYLSKPLHADVLRRVLEGACQLRAALPVPRLHALACSVDSLPSVPSTYAALLSAASEPSVQLRQLSRIIQTDVALQSKVLQFANSEIFGRSQHVTSAEVAVTNLGLKLVTSMVHVEEIFASGAQLSPLPGFSLEKLQAKAVLGAALAGQLVGDPQHAKDAETGALLRNVGQLVFAWSAREEFAQALQLAASSGRPLHATEREVFGASHDDLGSFLLGTWGLPAAIVRAVQGHHLEGDDPADTGGVQRAIQIADALVEERTGTALRRAAAGENLTRLGSPEQVERWRLLAEQLSSRPPAQ